MTLEQALHNVKVCYENFFAGKVKEHAVMQESIRLIEEKLIPKKENPEVKEDVGSDA